MSRRAGDYGPLHRHRPAHRWTNGDLAAKVGADLGLPPDPEQQWLLDATFAERAPERPAAFEVVAIAPRQNIKTSTFGIAALADLFVFGIHKHVWSAHLLDTAKATFRDFKAWIDSNAEYAELVDYYEGHQDLSIFRRDTGASIDFRARTGKGGRGLTGVQRVTLDEALYLEAQHVGAIYPTMLTRPGAQVRVASSAGKRTSAQLRRIRDRGRAGKDPRLAYVEYGAEVRRCAERECRHLFGTPGCALDDRDLWWQANCALWAGRITEEAIEDLRRSMPAEEFPREMYSWWDDPPSLGGALDETRWLVLADAAAERGAEVVYGMDLGEDRLASIAVAWRRLDGGAHVMLTQTVEGGGEPVVDSGLRSSEALARILAIGERLRGPVALGGPALDEFADALDDARLEVVKVDGAAFAAGCGFVADGLRDETLRHGDQAALNDAVRAARWRSSGADGKRSWQLKDSPEVGPLAAATRALYALLSPAPAKAKPPNLW